MSKRPMVVIMSMIMLCASLAYGQSAMGFPMDQGITGDNGLVQKEKAGRSTRFTDNENGTVTDNHTGLIWLKNADCFDAQDWATATSDAAKLSTGSCGLLDGSAKGDWRLPTIDEWEALVDTSHSNPALPSDYPFTNVQSFFRYWSSSDYDGGTTYAWFMYMLDGSVAADLKVYYFNYVWPVRSVQQVM